MSSTLAPAKLRALILQFYSENDPAKLQMGLDVNGIVEWTMRYGIDALNKMLLKTFGKEISMSKRVESVQEQFKRMSAALTPEIYERTQTFSVQMNNKESNIRSKLQEFYAEKDPSKLHESKELQFSKLVRFAMYHGLPKLNEKLIRKYGAGVDLDENEPTTSGFYPIETLNLNNVKKNNMTSSMFVGKNTAETKPLPKLTFSEMSVQVPTPAKIVAYEEENTAKMEIADNVKKQGANPFGIDTERLIKDLELFYKEVEDEEQLEVLEDVIEWACRIGMKNFNEKIEQMYGTSLDDVLVEHNRQPYNDEQTGSPSRHQQLPSLKYTASNNSFEIDKKESKKVSEDFAFLNQDETNKEEMEQKPFEQMKSPKPSRPNPYENKNGQNKSVVSREFDNMTDEEIKAELRAFYAEHDPENLAKLEQVTALARRLGREVLNEKLYEIYEDKLKPLPKQDISLTKGSDKSDSKSKVMPPGLGFTNVRPVIQKSFSDDKSEKMVEDEVYEEEEPTEQAVAALETNRSENVAKNMTLSRKARQMFGTLPKPEEIQQTSSINPSYSENMDKAETASALTATAGKITKLPGNFFGLSFNGKKDKSDKNFGHALETPKIDGKEKKGNISARIKNIFGNSNASKDAAVISSLEDSGLLNGFNTNHADDVSLSNYENNLNANGTTATHEKLASPLINMSKFSIRSAMTSFKNMTQFQKAENGQLSQNPLQKQAHQIAKEVQLQKEIPTAHKPKGISKVNGAVNVFETYGGTVVNNPMNEIAQRAQAIAKRNQEGTSVVTASDGTKTKVNIIMDCDRYELDIFTGACAFCGLAKNEHSKLAKRHVVNQILQDKQNELKNSNGLPSVSAIVMNMTRNVRDVNATPNFKMAKKTFTADNQVGKSSFLMLTSQRQRSSMKLPEGYEEDDYV